jgi:hypothetical protein
MYSVLCGMIWIFKLSNLLDKQLIPATENKSHSFSLMSYVFYVFTALMHFSTASAEIILTPKSKYKVLTTLFHKRKNKWDSRKIVYIFSARGQHQSSSILHWFSGYFESLLMLQYSKSFLFTVCACVCVCGHVCVGVYIYACKQMWIKRPASGSHTKKGCSPLLRQPFLVWSLIPLNWVVSIPQESSCLFLPSKLISSLPNYVWLILF